MKRFTETTKWADPWFMDLPAKWKLLWLYLLDNCDNAGVWTPNMRLAAVQIGEPIEASEALRIYAGRVSVLPSGKWHVERFVAFQYGNLSPDSRPHQQVIGLEKLHGIDRVSKGYPKGIDTLKDKDKDKDKEKEEEKRPDIAEEIYSHYPKKVGKQEALKAIRVALKSNEAEKLLEAVTEFAKCFAKWPEDDKRFILDPCRWFSRGHFDDDRTQWERRPATRNQQPENRMNPTKKLPTLEEMRAKDEETMAKLNLK